MIYKTGIIIKDIAKAYSEMGVKVHYDEEAMAMIETTGAVYVLLKQ